MRTERVKGEPWQYPLRGYLDDGGPCARARAHLADQQASLGHYRRHARERTK
jgi:hypothetical protein